MGRFRGKNAFTLLELQVAIIVIAFGIVTVSSVAATESRMLKKLHAKSRPLVTTTAVQPQR